MNFYDEVQKDMYGQGPERTLNDILRSLRGNAPKDWLDYIEMMHSMVSMGGIQSNYDMETMRGYAGDAMFIAQKEGWDDGEDIARALYDYYAF